ncbi:Protein of unknown function (DUF3292) [Geosmithia morbida]|uniref:Uncharacterized protein n=1 Tax=Geosmithia morbida TaxID=1094350 RepID=A0A9P4YVY8_9HYPO|nr:Protein of unknown function (DUF3292) [Geosmithia morbida]KAF4122024.1 Protein of unknown function (DUF3292) [Geosmithia morbida]
MSVIQSMQPFTMATIKDEDAATSDSSSNPESISTVSVVDLAPTTSHALAEKGIRHSPPQGKGASQFDHDGVNIEDLGWNGEHIPQPVVGGLEHDNLFILTRRFCKQMFHVRSNARRDVDAAASRYLLTVHNPRRFSYTVLLIERSSGYRQTDKAVEVEYPAKPCPGCCELYSCPQVVS